MKEQEKNRLANTLDKAQQAFWQVVAQEYKEAPTGDFSISDTINFDNTCEAALKNWLAWNMPNARIKIQEAPDKCDGCENDCMSCTILTDADIKPIE